MKKANRLLWVSFFTWVIFTSIFLFVSPPRIAAVTVTLSEVPSTISADPFTIKATISGAGSGVNYLRIDIYKEGTSQYFGETYNNTTWYNGSDGKQYFPATIVSGVDWSGTLQGRIGSPGTTEYDGTGSYRLRVRRYTASGGSASDNDNATAITIVFPTNTPIPSHTPTPQNTPTPTTVPTPTKTPTPTPTIKQEIVSSPLPDATITGKTRKPSPTSVLGMSTKSATVRLSSPTPTSIPKPTIQVQGIQTQADFVPLFFIGGGIFLLLSCAILTFRTKLERLWKRE